MRLRVRGDEREASLHGEVLTRHLVDGLHRLVLARGGRVQRVEVAPDLRVPRVQEDVDAHAPGAIRLDHVPQDAAGGEAREADAQAVRPALQLPQAHVGGADRRLRWRYHCVGLQRVRLADASAARVARRAEVARRDVT